MQRENEPVWPPTWVMVLGSLVIAVHLLLAFAMTLNRPSGPWPVQGAAIEADPPRFASTVDNFWLVALYQNSLRSSHSFHFSSLRQERQEIYFEASLKDDKGTVIRKVTYPDPEAPSSIQVRQRMLAQQLGNDIPLPPQQGVVLAAEGKELEQLHWWQQDGDHRFVLKQGNQNAVPRNQSFMQPSFSQTIAAKSFSRFLARQHSVPKIEITRSWYDPIMPMVLISDDPPISDDLRRFSSSYGELNP